METQMDERQSLPPSDGAPMRCAAIVPAESGPPNFGWQQCGSPATHIRFNQLRCEQHTNQRD